ncbi:hypothetical protein N7466_000369 [Penicillium verhagenii]|uniref:uncharacterized protein n=1 Tax=Penicillium verhagenii TaxID=1562060 RepID=UPI0025450691|nr:uncharacterized protein N7466_000369 [Penicillium verhagenii]KAJ5947354.1 hypothetical protein N7466_000369 [Penicillium verhagenii]
MQYKTILTVLFATAALAAPKPQDSGSSDSEVTDTTPSSVDDGDEVPSSIESVLMTGIPSTWLNDFYSNSAFMESEISAMQSGDYPAWVTSLPSAVEAYFTSEIQVEITEYESMLAAESTATGSDITISGTLIPSSTASSTSTPLSTGSTTATETTSGSSSTGSSGTTSSGSSSSGASSGAATSTSTGGAAAATGGLAISLAGAAGILGVALAL